MNLEGRWISHERLLPYALMGVVAPGILFIFFILFGSDSYQYWADRYHTTLTSIYIYSRLPSETFLGPLWREDTLAGSPWIISTATTPLALDVLLARLLHLSPFGIEMVGDGLLYGIAVTSMWFYLRQALHASPEAASVGAVVFSATLYWDSILNTNPIVPMAAAWMPAMLVMAHRLDEARGRQVMLPGIGLALLFWGCALHSTPATLPLTLLLVGVYAVAVFGLGWSAFRIGAALGIGLLLYSPFLWMYLEAGKLARKVVTVQASRGVDYWLGQVKVMVIQFALGLNRYGLYLVVMLIMTVWLGMGLRWSQETPRVRRVLWFATGMAVAIFMIELFHQPINEIKRAIPLLGGINILRFADFAGFGVATLFTWMLDYSLIRIAAGDLSPSRRPALRRIIVAVGVLGGLQIAHAAHRMQAVPSSIFPQNIVLFSGLALYAMATVSLLAVLYRRTGDRSGGLPLDRSGRLRVAVLLVASVGLITSVHAYRTGLVKPQGVGVKDETPPIMTYAQRYALPDDVLAVKGLHRGEGRVLDLTRPLNEETVMAGSESTMFPLAGIRVLSGYTSLRPSWYELLIHTGINGRSGRAWNIIQAEETGKTNFSLLPFLDVEYVLARPGSVLPGYHPVTQFNIPGKMLYHVQNDHRLGPAFISSGVRCFATDDEALAAIHAATAAELRERAILIAGDAAAVRLCAEPGGMPGTASLSSVIRTKRGQDRVHLEVENSAGGILTLSDTNYPGWKVLVNGKEQPLLRTYTALRGVLIEPGPQSVEFIYAPTMFALLFNLSLGGLACLLVLAGIVWLRDRNRYSPVTGGAEPASLTGSRGI